MKPSGWLPRLLVSTVIVAHAAAQDPDGDGDGLSDFREVHKHFTDPRKADSDGDGVPDSDWDERREYAYSVRSILQVLPPINAAEITDDYQDARVLEAREDCVEIEIVCYPLNTVGDALREDPRWREHAAAMKEYVEPGPTTNWDERMRTRMLAELKQDGVDVAKLSDRALVETVSQWLMKRSNTEDGFTTFMVDFEGGKPRPSKGQEARFAEELKRAGRTAEEQWDRELFGRGMFENKVHGTCTSSAIYLATGLRAVGIPTRTIVCTPVIDATDEREWGMLARGIRHHRVRRTIEDALEGARGGWTSHTFNEVWVGGRWRRLNYAKLGQGVLDEQFLGLMTHVHTFADHAEARMSRTWGLRSTLGTHDDLFGFGNPYSCISLSDRFGVHARVENPPASAGLTRLVVDRIDWYDDPKKNPGLTMKAYRTDDSAGHLLIHVDGPDGGLSGREVKRFHGRAQNRFVLRAQGRDEVDAHVPPVWWADAKTFYLRVEADAFAKMKKGIAYALEPAAQAGEWRWEVLPSVRITRR